MRARTLQRPCPDGREQPPLHSTKEAHGLCPCALSAKRRTQSRSESEAFASTSAKDVEVRKVSEPFLEIEPVPDEELVRDREPDVADGEVFDQAAIRTVEEGHRREGARRPERQGLDQVVERQARVDHVLDDQNVAARDLGVEVLQEPDAGMSAGVGACGVAGELHEVEGMVDRQSPGEIGEEDDAGLERRNQQRLEPRVVAGDLPPELVDTRLQLLAPEVDVPQTRLGSYDASSSWYRSARRSMSRL
jgi:hypothetical protein